MELKWRDKIEGDQFDDLCRLYRQEWWTKDRTPEQVEKMLAGSDLLFVGCDADNRLVGFARVLTDYVFKCMIFDVIVDEDHRGFGYGATLVNEILDHHKLKNVTSFELYCPEGIASFYEKLGFERGTSKLLSLKR